MAGRGAAGGLVLLLCMLSACAGGRSWELAGQPGLMLKVQQFYESRALEEGGRCPAPLMQGVARSQVLSDDQDQMVVALSYYYRDWVRDDDDCEPLRPGRCWVNPTCRGFAERTFTIDKGQDGLEVVGMSGPQRGGPQRR